MSGLSDLLVSVVRKKGRAHRVSLLLSGGVDSLSVGIALAEAGREVVAYTYELEGHPSLDRPKAERTAKHFGWPLRVVTVPSLSVREDFLCLAVDHGCRKKVQFEVTQPLLHVFPCIDETEIWSGFNADDHYGNTRQCVLEQHRMKKAGASCAARKAAFDGWRANAYRKTASSASTWWHAQKVARIHGKRLFDPYLANEVRSFFHAYDHDQLSSPRKPLVREALCDHLKGLPDGSIAVGVRLQIGSGVDKMFAKLLGDPTINRFERPYRSISPLCLRWAREVEFNPEKWQRLRRRTRATAAVQGRVATREPFRPYGMTDVQAASAAKRFTVISTFSGGGGSTVGYSLAGGQVRAAIDFVEEAARTYRTNFPACHVVCQDIRDFANDRRRTDAFLRSVGLRRGDVDILDGSPPCSEFSTAGRGPSDQTRLKRYSDVQQAGLALLPFDLVDLIAQVRPKIVIIENVPGLAQGTKAPILHNLLRALRYPTGVLTRRQYFADHRILSAADYGTPQKRRRLIIIAVRYDVAKAAGIGSDDKVSTLYPSAISSEISVREALADLQQQDWEVAPWSKAASPYSIGRLIRLLPRNPAKHLRLAHVDHAYSGGSNFGLTRCAWHLPAPTLTVMGQGPNALGGVLHPEEDRKFTLPELKRLTGLPDDYVLTGTLAQGAERICRMVPPLMIKAIAESVYQRVLLPYRERKDAAA